MDRSRLVSTMVVALLLAVSATANAQVLDFVRKQIKDSEVLTIRMYYNPDLQPPTPVMEIFLKDPSQPGFVLRGESGKVLESFHRMHELARWFKQQKVFTVIFRLNSYVTEVNHPYWSSGSHPKRMMNIHGFYGLGYPAQGAVPWASSGSKPGGTQMLQAEPMLMDTGEGSPPGQRPGGEPSRERMMNPPPHGDPHGEPMPHDAPPGEQIGFCCVHGEVVEAPAHACQMEGGQFFRDPGSAHAHCQGQRRR